MNDKTEQSLTSTLRHIAKSALYKTAMIGPSYLIAAADTIDDLRAQLAEAQRELNVQRCTYGHGRAPSVDGFVVTFRCEDEGVVGTTAAKIHSVSKHDDGVIEVVIDHWPWCSRCAISEELSRIGNTANS